MNKTASIVPGALIALTALSGLILSAPRASAEAITFNVEIPANCSLTINQTEHTLDITPGDSDTIGTSTVKSVCNDPGGLAVYAVGFTGDSYGNTNLVNNVGGTSYTIPSATDQAPGSQWNMTLTQVSGAYAPTIATGYDSPHAVPQQYTKVAYRNSMTDYGTNATGANFTASFDIDVALDQPAGTYTGKVKFLLVHPNINAIAPETLYTMQNVAQWEGNISQGQTTKAVDERDGEVYSVARLADGNLWMTKNLRLNLETANITAQNTNSPSMGFLTTISSKPTSSSTWCTDTNATCFDQVYYNTSNLGNTTTDSDGYAYDERGVYYNWYTATAGTGTYDTPQGTDASGSICPSGWRLPRGTITSGAPSTWTGEYWKLSAALAGLDPGNIQNSDYSTITSATTKGYFFTSPNNFLLTGNYSGSGIYQTTSGYYWTAASGMSTNHFAMNLEISHSASSFSPGISAVPTFLGCTIRCVADQRTLQTVSQWGNSVALGETVEAIDERDGQTYKVKRLKMNAAGTETALWMSNLNLGAETLTVLQLDNTNTNLAPGAATITKSTFESWIKSSSSDSLTSPELIPVTASNASNNQSADSYGNKYGTLYNYAAASAGTYLYGTTGAAGDATSDLCPSGWRMPTGGSAGELKKLTIDGYNVFNTTSSQWNTDGYATVQQDLGFSLAGAFDNNNATPSRQGTYGGYWSSSYTDSTGMRKLWFRSNNLNPTDYDRRSYGFSIRCIAQ